MELAMKYEATKTLSRSSTRITRKHLAAFERASSLVQKRLDAVDFLQQARNATQSSG